MRFPVRLLLMAPGPLRYEFVKEGIDFYSQRVKPFLDFETHFPRIKVPKDPQERRRREAEGLRRYFPPRAYRRALDEKGRCLSSRELASLLNKLFSQHREFVVFAGGPEGLAEDLLKEAQMRLSLSPLTLNHELALLVFCEALYRSLTILSGLPYHRE